MLIDTRSLQENALIEGDVIIAGGGMAGITLARELGDAGLDVVILESGGEQPDKRTQALYQGDMTLSGPGNEPRKLPDYLITSRARYFGGSGNVWGAKCAPLDPVDFEKRDWVPYSGWPLSRAQMQPFYDRACRTLDLPVFGPAPEDTLDAKDPLFGARSSAFTRRPRRYSRATGATGTVYADFKRAAANHPRVRVYLNANVSRVRLNNDGRRVTALDVRELDGRRHQASGRHYILALGGIENVRLLLVSDDVQRSGIGNDSGWVGCAFQGHTTIAQAKTTSLSIFRTAYELASFNNMNLAAPHAVIGTSDATQRRLKSVNFTATVTGMPSGRPTRDQTVGALAQRLSAVPVATQRGVYFMIEHTPNRDSRLSLSAQDRDELGMPRLRLDMCYSELEFAALERSIAMLAVELGRCGVGRAQWACRRDQLIEAMSSPSRHHMGTTRMAASPREGVVDERARVHGVENLRIAGSSVFPTSGIANPTLTLLALTHRLADDVAAELKS